MTATRQLTEQEAKEIRAFYLPKKSWFHYRDITAFLLFLGAGLVISIPFAALFFCSGYLYHHKPMSECIHIGLLGFIPGPAVALLFAVIGWIGANRSAFPDVKRDLKKGICRLKRYRCERAWLLVDQGNADDPDLLLDIGKGRLLAIMAEDLRKSAPPGESLCIAELPISGVTVEVVFSGKAISLSERAVVTDCIWRNDDLSYNKPFKLNRAPEGLRAALDELEG